MSAGVGIGDGLMIGFGEGLGVGTYAGLGGGSPSNRSSKRERGKLFRVKIGAQNFSLRQRTESMNPKLRTGIHEMKLRDTQNQEGRIIREAEPLALSN